MNQKEVVKLAVIETNLKNISDKLDEHTSEQRKDFDKVFKLIDDHIKATQSSLESKADKKSVEDLHIKYIKLTKLSARFMGAISAIVLIITFLLTIVDKIHW